jgi:hypothetical protein
VKACRLKVWKELGWYNDSGLLQLMSGFLAVQFDGRDGVTLIGFHFGLGSQRSTRTGHEKRVRATRQETFPLSITYSSMTLIK